MRKLVVTIMAVAIVALAAGCGNGGSAQTSSAAASKSASSTASSAAGKSEAKKTFEDQNDGTFEFTNASLEYKGGKSVLSFSMKHTREMDIKVKMVQVKLTDIEGHYNLIQKQVDSKIAAGEKLEVSIEYDGDLSGAVELLYQYQIG